MEAGAERGTIWREAFGALTFDADAPAATPDTIFDLASLTKVVATTTLAMQLVDAGRIRLSDPVARWIPECRGDDRASTTIADLLAHCSGLTAWLPLYRDHTGRADYQHAIATLPLEYVPRTQSVYSDLGFILLGFILEDAGRGPFLDQTTDLLRRLALEPLAFRPPTSWRPNTAPTELDPWRGRLLVGEVHDENCWALGGAAGHAGLFGSVGAVGRFAQLVLGALKADRSGFATLDTLRRFITKSDVPGSSRALGWDTMQPTSSCGTRLSAEAFGHTGFTGTSLWIDPTRDLYIVLLTNRVHPSRTNEAIRSVRPALHDAIVASLA